MGKPQRKNDKKLGRLSAFGLHAAWQCALLLPDAWENLRIPFRKFNSAILPGDDYLVHGRLGGTPQFDFRSKPPRLKGSIIDSAGHRIRFTVFGDSKKFEQKLKENQDSLYLYGSLDYFNDLLFLKNPQVIPYGWVGRLRPRYPGKHGVITPETVRDRILSLLNESTPVAAEWMTHELRTFGNIGDLCSLAGCPDWTLEEMLRKAHLPESWAEGVQAQAGLEFLASLGIIQKAKRGQLISLEENPLPIRGQAVLERLQKFPFQLSEEQLQAIRDVVKDMRGPTPMRRFLAGDVGTGKSAIYYTAVAACYDLGEKSAVLLPNLNLANQAARELKALWPDLPVQLVTGNSSKDELDSPVLVGTTALNFRLRDKPDKPTLVVVDEQQKMSVQQREELVGPRTHTLEISATCIPRTMALARYGLLHVSYLKEQRVEKSILTRIRYPDQKSEVMRDVWQSLQKGWQVLIIYPQREDSAEEQSEEVILESETDKRKEEDTGIKAVEAAYLNWDSKFPGRVRMSHSKMSDDDKERAILDMIEDRADLICSTSIIEVGLNLPRARHMVIVDPDRYGLNTLHQMRGRLARYGGEGMCDLLLTKKVKEKALNRLQVLERTMDGMEIAYHDMMIRGVGDLGANSTKQAGADETFLFGRPVRVELLERALEIIKNKEME